MATEQEILEFVIKLKMEEMKRGLNATEQEIREFHGKAARDFKATGAEVAKLEKSGKDLAGEWDKSTKKMEQSLKGLQTAATVSLAAITASAGLTMKTFADFQAQLNSLEAVSGATAAQMDALEGKAKSLGESTKYSASQMAETSFELSKLGFVSEEIIDSIDGIVSAAAASGVSLAEAGELVAGTVRGFGLDASEAVKVADVLASAANASALSMGDLSLSMKYVAPIAAASNQSLTDMTGIMGILANNMIRGEQAGTSLRAMMARLQNPSSEMSDIMGKLGLSIEDSEGKMKRMPVILGELREKMNGLKDTTKSRVLGELFGTEALSAASVLMNTSNEQLGEMIRKMEDSSGASKEMADIMQQGVNYELDILKSQAEAAGIAFGEEFAPAAEEAIRLLGSFLQHLTDIPDSSKQAILQLSLLAGGVGVASLAFKGFTGQMALAAVEAAGLTLKFQALHTAILGLPGLIGAGIGLAANYGINAYSDALDQDTEQRLQALDDDKTNERLKDTSAKLRKTYDDEMAKIAKQEKKYRDTLKGLALDKALSEIADQRKNAVKLLGDMSGLTLQDMSASLETLKREKRDLQVEINELKKAPKQLRALEAELQQERKKGGRSLRAAELEKEIGGINLVDNGKKIRQLQGQIARLDELQSKFQKGSDERNKALKDKKPTGPNSALEDSLASDGAAKEADKLLKKQTDTYFDEVDKRLDKKKQALEREAALTELSTASQNAVDDKLVQNAEKVALKMGNTYGNCLRGVNQAMYDPYGKVIAYANSAYEVISSLEKDERFKEIQWDGKSTLPAGAVVAWEKGSSPHGHISIADGKGNEISDHKTKQMTSHYGGGRARVFVDKNAKGASDAEAKQKTILSLQKEYNKEIQAAILFQATIPKSSEAWAAAEKKIVELKKEAGQLGIDVINAETEARKKAAEMAAKLAKEQADNFKALTQQVDSFKSSIQQRTDDLAKQFAQESMTPLEKLKDDYAREIAAAKKSMAELQESAGDATINDAQRKKALDDIGKATEKINGLQEAQNKLIASAEAKEALRKKYEAMEDEIAAELRAVDAKKRKLALEVQLGQLSPEDRAKRLLEINHEELAVLDKRLKKEQAIAADRKFNDDQRKSAAERALLIEGQITETTNQQLVIAHELGEARRQEYLQIQSTLANGLITSLDTMGKMVGFSESIGSNFRSVLSAVLEINNNLQTITGGDMDLDGNVTQTLGRTDILSSLMSGSLTSDLNVSPGVVAGMVGFSAQALLGVTNLYADFYESLRGDQSQMIESTIAFNREMATLELSAAELRLSQAREKGQETLDLELEIIEKRRKMRESEIDDAFFQLSTIRTGFLGLGYSATDRFKQSLFIKSSAEQRKQIEDETNAEIEQARKAHINRLIDDAKSSKISKEDNELRRAELKALQTDDPLDDLEVERTRRKTQAVRDYISEIDRLSQLQISHDEKNALMTGAADLLNDEVAYIESDVDDKRKKAREDLNKATEVTLGLLEEENAILRAQRTADPYDDLYAAADKELKENQRAMEVALAQEGLTEEQKQKIRDHYRELELTARHKFQKSLSDLQKSELQRVNDDYKTLLQQQATLIREGVETESEKYQALIDTEETKLKAAEDRVKAEEEKLEELRKKRDAELQAFDPEDGVQSAVFRADMAAYDPSAAAYKGVDELSNVDNRDSLDTVSGETKRKGLLEQADLTEFAAKNAFRKEEIKKGDFVKRMQEAQLMRAKAAEMELAEDGLTTRRKLELEEEWANAYETYQDLARQAIDARYDVEEKRINENIAKHEEQAAGYQKTIDGYQSSIDEMNKAADEKIKPIEDAIKAAERSTRNWAGAWDDVASGIRAAKAAMEKEAAAAASSYSGGRDQSTNTANYGKNYVSGNDGVKYQTTSDLFAAMGATKMATGGRVPPGYPNDTYLALLSSGEEVKRINQPPPLPLSEMRPAGTVNNITQNRYVTISGNHIQSNVDMYDVAMEAIRDNEIETQRNFGTQAGRWA